MHLKLLFSTLRRHFTPRNHHHRLLSSSIPIKPVAYPTKPQPQPQQPPEQTSQPETETETQTAHQESNPSQRPLRQFQPRQWTRDDAPLRPTGPTISPVSYKRVAPLPEYRPPEPESEVAAELEEERMRSVARRIEMDTARVRRGFLGVVREEEEVIPYPTIIKAEKRLSKTAIDLAEAIREVKACAHNKKRNFVETVEAHVNLGVDPRRGDQMVRGALTLPHGSGKTVRVAVFAEGASADEARTAGADVVGGDELIEEIRTGGGKLSFDKCIATPMFMPRLSKVARILGPRGLMPNPKLGSVTNDVSGAVKAAKSGRIDFKVDKTAIVHAGLGKIDFPEECLRENIGAFLHAILLAKPVGLKKTSKYAGYVKNFTLSSTMGPGFPVTIQSLSAAADHYSNKAQVK